MPRVLADNEIDLEEEAVDLVMTAAEEASALASFKTPAVAGDLSDGGQFGRAHIYPTKDGVKQMRGRAAARRAWMWDGTETVLPLAWDPEGKHHDGARKYLRKKHCLCCHEAGFTGECRRCVRSNCERCAGGTDKSKIIPNFYLSKDKVPFPQKFYGPVDCFLPMCVRRNGAGFKSDAEMRMHARGVHREEYASYTESEQARKVGDTEALSRRVDELTSMLLRQGMQPPPVAVPAGTPEAPLYVSDKPKKK